MGHELGDIMNESSNAHLAAEALLRDHDVHTVELATTDLYGHPRGRRIPREHFLRSVAGHEVSFPEALFAATIDCNIVESDQITMDSGFFDVRLLADMSSLRLLGHRPGYALLFASVHTAGGDVHPMSARDVLKAQVARAEALGFSPWVATELELYLMNPDGTPIRNHVQYASLAADHDLEVMVAEMRQGLVACELDVENSNMEFGPSQLEINVGPSDAVRTADNTIVFKSVVKEIARRHGVIASFMPKPMIEASGSGMHVHQSLTADGQNLFADAAGAPNQLMAKWLAGQLHHAAAMSLLASPLPNGFRRFSPYTFAPTHATWGSDNRTVLARCLTHEGSANRIEFRLGGSDANPYLLLAALIAAGCDGVERGLELPAESIGDAYSDPGPSPALPTTTRQAIDAFGGSALAGMLPDVLVRMLVAHAEAELAVVGEALDASPEAVAAIEIERYLVHS